MKAVKAIVIVMTALLVIGLGLVAYGMMTRASRVAVEPPRAAAARGFGAIGLGQPDGSRIAGMTTAGDGLLLLRIEGGGSAERVVVVDLSSGRVLGAVGLGAAP
ncbi:MAG: hypothetical protein H7840_07695 [Alphaproteobacteria bacterium]